MIYSRYKLRLASHFTVWSPFTLALPKVTKGCHVSAGIIIVGAIYTKACPIKLGQVNM